MKTTSTLRSIPTRFVTLELDEHEAQSLLTELADAGAMVLITLAAGLRQALAPEPAQATRPQVAPTVPSASTPAVAPVSTRKGKRWTCPICGKTSGFYDRFDHHRRKHPDLPLPERLINYPGHMDIRTTALLAEHVVEAEPTIPFVAVEAPPDARPAAVLETLRDEAEASINAWNGDVLPCNCGKKFATAGALQAHIARDHDGVEPDPTELEPVSDHDTTEPLRMPPRDWPERSYVGIKGTRL